jgi:hypothetical protein
LAEEVNRTLVKNNNKEQVISGNPTGGPASFMGGTWLELNNASGRAFVFTMMHSGITAACIALTDSNGRVKEILPLGKNAEQIIEELPLPVYRFYQNRIEQEAQKRMGGRNR